jgi:2-amino-4-hydroxy-6-hydroxymethyldihydropteridine diphosphokinase
MSRSFIESREIVEVYIALGANLGDRAESIHRALKAIAELPTTTVKAVSGLYETKACFVEDQPDFLNACAHLETSLPPRALLDELLGIETAMGRRRTLDKGPRTIDLDLLLYGDQILDEEGLTVPHPDLHRRDFVLRPLNEIAGEVHHPVFGRAIKDL